MAKAPKSEFVQHSLFGATSEIAPKAPIELLDRRDVTLLSLFNGISGARLACERDGLKITKHWISEIDPYANQITMDHYPDSIQLGDVTKWRDWNLDELRGVDYMIFGSPCQSLSIAKRDRKGLDSSDSGLFWAALDILREIKPKYFIMENVASMTDEAMDIISAELGVHCRLLNSALVSGQNRARLYWSNATIGNVEDKGILLQDILESGSAVKEKSYNLTQINYAPKDFFEKSKGCVIFEGPVVDRKKSYCPDASYWKGSNGVKGYLEKGKRQVVFLPVNKSIQIGNINNSKSQGNRVYSVKGKSVSLCANAGGLGAKTGLYKVDLPDGNYIIRKLTPTECERLQNYPDGWTAGISKTQRYKCLGNSFTVDIIAHIVKQTLKLS